MAFNTWRWHLHWGFTFAFAKLFDMRGFTTILGDFTNIAFAETFFKRAFTTILGGPSTKPC
jgi:hypothetical protein